MSELEARAQGWSSTAARRGHRAQKRVSRPGQAGPKSKASTKERALRLLRRASEAGAGPGGSWPDAQAGWRSFILNALEAQRAKLAVEEDCWSKPGTALRPDCWEPPSEIPPAAPSPRTPTETHQQSPCPQHALAGQAQGSCCKPNECGTCLVGKSAPGGWR